MTTLILSATAVGLFLAGMFFERLTAPERSCRRIHWSPPIHGDGTGTALPPFADRPQLFDQDAE